MSPQYGHVDTGQRIPCFDRCQLTITWMMDATSSPGPFAQYPRQMALVQAGLNLLKSGRLPRFDTRR